MPAWIRDGKIVVYGGKVCISETCPPDCDSVSCGCGYTVPADKRWKVDVSSLMLGNRRCSCCETLAGPYVLGGLGQCRGCCLERFCTRVSGPVITDYYYYVLSWIEAVGVGEEAECTINVAIGLAQRTRSFVDEYESPDCPPTELTAISHVNYKGAMEDDPGELTGPWTLTKQPIDEICEYSDDPTGDGEGPDDGVGGAINDPAILNPCACFDAAPETIGVSLVVDDEDCAAPDEGCIEPTTSDCSPCAEGTVQPSIFVEFTGADCCEDIEGELHAFDFLPNLSSECCLAYGKNFATYGCVGFAFSAISAFVLICYDAEADETTIVQGWLSLAGDVSLTAVASATIDGRLDCEDFEETLGYDGDDPCGGAGMAVTVSV